MRARTKLLGGAMAVGLAISAGPALPAASIPAEKPTVPQAWIKAIDEGGRPYTDYRRDHWTKSPEMYAFAQIKPGDKVLELYVADGFNLKQVVQILGPTGHFYGINFIKDTDTMWEQRDNQDKQALAGQIPRPTMEDGALEDEGVTEYGNVTVMLASGNQFGGNVPVPEQLDVVFSDHYHDLHDPPAGEMNMIKVNQSLFRDIKPGGVYMVGDSVANDGAGMTQAETLHRTEPKALIAEVTQAGFVLEAEDNTWRRNDDTHTATAQCEDCRDTSDRYFYRFRKPANAPGDMRPKTDPLTGYYGNTLVMDMGYRETHPGSGRRHLFVKPNGTFQEYGYYSVETAGAHDPTPTRLGTWFWDASGHFCERIEYPAREKSFVLCNDYMVPREMHKLYEVNVGAKEPGHVMLIPGRVLMTAAEGHKSF